MSQERRQCEFFLLRYVPDPVRNEFVHIGVLIRDAQGAGAEAVKSAEAPGRVAAVRFTSDWRRVRCLDPEADTGMLEGLETELRRRFVEEPAGNLWHVLEDSFSNCIQMTTGKAYLAESIEAGVEELMRLYVEPQKREKQSRLSGRAAIQSAMRSEFERAGVWDLMRKRIAASEYTRPGDPLRIDLGYRSSSPERNADWSPGRVGDVIRMFHAVSLEPSSGMGVEMAKVLAFSAASLYAGVERIEKAQLELTAVIEPVSRLTGAGDKGAGRKSQPVEGGELESERLGLYRFAVETMEEHRIRVLTTADLGRVAETARRELRV